MQIKIEEVEMSERLRNCLLRHGIKYLEELYDYTDEDYFKIKNIGRKAIYEAQMIVKSYTSYDKFIDDMDEAFPDGKYVEPSPEPPRIKFRDMDAYCKEIGKKPTELTEEEMNQFRY